MVQSQNKTVDMTIKATSLNGLTNYGSIMIGDKAFEFYSDRNEKDYIQIPWGEIKCVYASVYLKGKYISRFALSTKENGNFTFSTRDNKATLRAINKYIDSDNLVRSLTFFQVLIRGIKHLFKIKI
ncbi:MAG: DUF956 family protein [Erysipelotrichaceae bacterium]|nr:DUF956 family protein [Erysipelotrichaceae bacterium]